MTLGNDPQPLTRRQARELASRREQTVSGDSRASADLDLPVVPAPLAPAPVIEPAPVTSPADAAEARPTMFSPPTAEPPAFAPRVDSAHRVDHAHRADQTHRADQAHRVDQVQGHNTLTRREMRALQAAKSENSDEFRLTRDPRGSTSAALIGTAAHPFAIDALHIPAAPAKVAPPVEFLVEATPRNRVKSRPGVLHPPVGHWSLARDEVDDQLPGVTQIEPFDQIVARGISAGGIPTTTNALILPSIPHRGSTSGPLFSTGEIMVTGSIDLPRSLGSTGSLPNVFDSSDMDQMLDQLDEGGHHSDVAPMSASRAVSTRASTRGVMAVPVKRGLTVPAVLIVTAGVLAFGVLALIVAGYVFRIF